VMNGYDIRNGDFYKGADYKDLMSYCQPLWISDYTYRSVLEWRASHSLTSGPTQRVLLVWGRIGASGAILEPGYEIHAPVQLPQERGTYSLEGMDPKGRVLFSLSFAGSPLDHMPGQRVFAFTVPLGSAISTLTALRLLKGGKVVARQSRSASAEVATSVAPAPVRLLKLDATRSRLEWDPKLYVGAMVRDAATGEVLAFLRGGSGEVSGTGDLDVFLSDGVTSMFRRVGRTPR